MNRIRYVAHQRQLIAADVPRRACRPEGIKAASDRFAIRFVITSGVGAPTGLSSVVPNAAARRIVVTTTAALAPSRDTPRRASWPAVSVWYRPQLQLHDSKRHTAYSRPLSHVSLQLRNKTSGEFHDFLGGQVGLSFFSRFGAVCRSSSAFRSVATARSHRPLSFRSSRNENQIRPREEGGPCM